MKISNCEIYRDANDFFMNRMSYQLYVILQENGISASLTESETSGKDDAGNPLLRFTVKQDDTLKPGIWKTSAVTGGMEVTASTYYGFLGAFRKIAEWGKSGSFDPQTGSTKTGGFTDVLNEIEAAARYAYDRQAKHRVMYYNIAFKVPSAAYRNRLHADLVAQYLPDVLACQEYGKSMRETTDADGNPAPEYELAVLLKDMGYRETLDPTVHNAGEFGSTLVHDSPVLGKITYNVYGTGGNDGRKIIPAVGDPYYTCYNCAPLFYNTKTTKYIEGEYYWYQNHWDGSEMQIEGGYKTPGNGTGDWGSKSATWGLFESIATGERYVVIGTHMCSRSDRIRGVEAIELIDLIEAIQKKYKDVPILLGGDLNGGSMNYNVQVLRGTMPEATVKELTALADKELPYSFNGDHTISPYKNFAKLAEYVGKLPINDLQVSGTAKVFTSNLATAGYRAPVYHKDLQLELPDPTNHVHIGNDCIDHIMSVNPDTIEPMVVGVIADDRVLSGSDHLPIFLDFNINSRTGK